MLPDRAEAQQECLPTLRKSEAARAALATRAPLEVVQQNARHASLDTTTRYVTTEAARRMEAMQAVWDAGKGD
ncbi:putative integrase/recombinase protein [Cupriavidus basilensis OR16]|uniref:Putative integrase/recombinase protein n=1 Tax=Cupriavidus basilensis OR16 TaxID=1127483 RepID=H1S021_9BURK|nr:putative integrase/recombinase protein [Cupriavidus basilensis OR16]